MVGTEGFGIAALNFLNSFTPLETATRTTFALVAGFAVFGCAMDVGILSVRSQKKLSFGSEIVTGIGLLFFALKWSP